MICLTKPFTCIIVSSQCTYIGIYSFLKYVKTRLDTNLIMKRIPIMDKRRQERIITELGVECIVYRFKALCNGYDEVLPTVAGARDLRYQGKGHFVK